MLFSLSRFKRTNLSHKYYVDIIHHYIRFSYQTHFKSMLQFDEEKLFNAFKSGDIKAFNKIFDLYYASLYRKPCFEIVKDTAVAQDIATETMVKIWINIHKVETYDHLRALIYLIARNLSYNHIRDEKTRQNSYDVLSDTLRSTMVSNPTAYNNIFHTIKNEIAVMNKEDQLIAEQLIFQQLKPKEIAELMNKNEQTVRNKKTIILKKIKDALKKRDSLYE